MYNEFDIALSLLTFVGLAATFLIYFYIIHKNWLIVAAALYWVGTSSLLSFLFFNIVYFYRFGIISVFSGTLYITFGVLKIIYNMLKEILFDF